jgi:hypothetical protein
MKTLLILPILLLATSTVTKGFPKASGGHMDRFREAAGVDNIDRLFNNVGCTFLKLVHVVIRGFRNLFDYNTFRNP